MKFDAEYWQKRFNQMEQAQHDRGAAAFSEIDRKYREAQKTIEQKIAVWYQRFADNNHITLPEARKLLTGSELSEFKWDVNEYIRHGKENAVSSSWMKELENASARYHINRLEALKLQCQQDIEVLFGGQKDLLDRTMSEVYQNGYYHTAYEIQRGIGVGWDFATLDTKTIDKVINKPWAVDGSNFSDRIWKDKQKLVSELDSTLTQNIVLGEDPQKAIDKISKRLGVSKNNAGKLVMTEEAFFSSAGQQDCFKELDVEQYEIVATLDGKTSEICRSMDGKVFKMSEWKVGVTAPPFHPWCRTTTIPHFDDEFDVGERAARSAEGKTYYVPANTKYKDWKRAFVDGDKSDLQEVKTDDTIKKEPSEAMKYIKEACEVNKVEYRPVKKLSKPLSSDEIIERLAGGDMTKGSCASLGFAYIGNRHGLDVLDFRGGNSQEVFSRNTNIKKMLELPGVEGSITMVKKEIQGTIEVLRGLEPNKEYYLATGRHAAIVRRIGNEFQYLELQSAYKNGWKSFNTYGSAATTLHERFGCRKTVDRSFGRIWEKSVVLMDVDSFAGNDEFEELLGYINTVVDEQKKGVSGSVK